MAGPESPRALAAAPATGPAERIADRWLAVRDPRFEQEAVFVGHSFLTQPPSKWCFGLFEPLGALDLNFFFLWKVHGKPLLIHQTKPKHQLEGR